MDLRGKKQRRPAAPDRLPLHSALDIHCYAAFRNQSEVPPSAYYCIVGGVTLYRVRVVSLGLDKPPDKPTPMLSSQLTLRRLWFAPIISLFFERCYRADRQPRVSRW
jgi:hypothetical protein